MPIQGKGQGFERKLSKLISLWWTCGVDDDVFWRSNTSGARATNRKRSGKRAVNQHGDLAAVNPIGQPLMDVCSFEFKKGYNDMSFLQVLDRPRGQKNLPVQDFIEQAATQAESVMGDREDESPCWPCIVFCRDRRRRIIAYPREFHEELASRIMVKPRDVFECWITFGWSTEEGEEEWVATRFEEWMEWAHPSVIQDIADGKPPRKRRISQRRHKK